MFVSKSSRLRNALRCALNTSSTLALLTLTASATAAEPDSCFAPLPASQAEVQTHNALPAVQNVCIRDVHESRAAVLLPAADTQGERWGFLDNQGQLVIKPVFEKVGDYHFGTAAAMQQGKWGFIDLTGNWMIPPAFDHVQPFTESGLAVVTAGGKTQIIDRKGAQVGKALDELVDDATLSDGVPARLSLTYNSVLLSPDGVRHVATDKMEVVEPFGPKDLFIAFNASKGYGIVDGNLTWRVLPQYSAITLDPQNPSVAMAKNAEGITLIRTDGVPDEQKYLSVSEETGAFWLAKTAEGIKLLDNSAGVIATFSEAEASSLYVSGDYVLNPVTKDALTLYVPGRKQPLSLPVGSEPWEQDTGEYLITTKGNPKKVNAIVAPSGGIIGGSQNVGWLAQITGAEVINHRLWLRNEQGEVVNIVDASGKALLTQKNISTLDGSRIEPLNISNDATSAQSPLALIRPGSGNAKNGAGFLRPDGSLQLESKWQDIQPADASGNIEQFIVTTAEGTGVIDAQGKMVIPLTEDNISPFVHGYALDYLDGKLTALDHAGKHYDLPGVFEIESVGNGWFRYRETAADGALWGIFDINTQKTVVQPSYQDVGDYANGLAAFRAPGGLWGIVDSQGKTIVEAKYAKAKRINSALWLLTQPAAADQTESSVVAEIIGNDAKARIAPTAGLSVTQFSDGRILATSFAGQSWLLDPQGNIELHEQQTRISALGDWVKLSRKPQQGYISAQGEWQIQPVAEVAQSSAFVQGRALRSTPAGYELIDDKGVRVAAMPQGRWSMPSASAWSVSYDPQDGAPATRYVDNTGKLMLTVQGQASLMVNDHAVLTRSDGTKTWINAQGKQAEGMAYADLGLPVDDLAFAKTNHNYGFVDMQGNFVIAPLFSAVSPFDSGVAVVSTPAMSMMIDKTGKPLARVDRECGIAVLYGTGSERQWPVAMPENCRP
ncbi:WG repeat-containing protein [Rahnella sp. C60]|uniref:WG repeat-containing protein n=1 Tax=Rahnella perminowiae TaxID=2816244 RepID=UPI001C27E502|nr:WG repeat-containing protein [Rahnella perminowiae]MBU9818115.1 WG repeat-containing protein [Rahnella perminowiae]